MGKLLSFILLVVVFSSCRINSNLMLKTDKYYEFSELNDSIINSVQEYRIAPNDIIEFSLFANDGWRVLELVSGEGQGSSGGNNQRNMAGRNVITYTVQQDGTIKLPAIQDSSDIPVAGLTIYEAEDSIANVYKQYFKNPYVQVRVLNKRVIVFPGGGGDAKVITLENNNTTLMEVLASANGIPPRGDASKIKLMRKIDGVRYVYAIDLSTIEGLKYTDMLVQANDYIYVEPVPEVAREILSEISPILSILSSTFIIYSVFNTFSQ